jgi:hypothetical protein
MFPATHVPHYYGVFRTKCLLADRQCSFVERPRLKVVNRASHPTRTDAVAAVVPGLAMPVAPFVPRLLPSCRFFAPA